MSKQTSSATFSSYLIGYGLSVLLTLEAYALVTHRALAYWPLFLVIIALAVTQLAVQLYFFLHLGDETKPRWRLMTFVFATLTVTIVVAGSIWIMNNLDYHHNHSTSVPSDSYIIKDEGIK